MSLIVKNTKDLTSPDNFKWKVLIYAPPGYQKTLWTATADKVGKGLGVAACETGHGSGLLTLTDAGVDYVTPETYEEFDALCSGKIFADKDVIALDSLSAMSKTFVKDFALKQPRKYGDTVKRKAGVPELDDYGTMGSLTYRMLERILKLPKHLIVTATERIIEANPEEGRKDTVIGPDLPGQMFQGSAAMFDTVMRMRFRSKLRDPKDAKSRHAEYYFVTVSDGIALAKCRNIAAGKPLLDAEEVFDRETGKGSFPDLLNKILGGYAARKEAA